MQKKGYKDIEFSITSVGEGRWKWAFYPKTEDGAGQSEVMSGTRVEAEIACKKAIDAWLNEKAGHD